MILAFDTSCDDTSVACLKGDRFSNLIPSQIDIHAEFGGVIPEIAARKHAEVIGHLTKKALEDIYATLDDIDYIAVTIGPGLAPSLLVGVSFAKALAYSIKKPIIPVNHIEGHMFAPFFGRKIEYPFLSLIISGGHTHLFLVEGFGKYKLLGKTLDDAVGEAFDKVARILGLSYPGGPVIDRLSKTADPYRFNIPQGLKDKKTFNFSFSGVKTHVKNLVKKMDKLSKTDINDIAASFQRASIEILLRRCMEASRTFGVKILSISGGVSANSYLRAVFEEAAQKNNIKLVLPQLSMTTDNALMIAYAASLDLGRATHDYSSIEAYPSLKLV